MRRILFVHAGPPKTATTAIQRFFSGHADLFALQGLYWPKTGTAVRSFNHMALALALRDGTAQSAYFAELARELSDMGRPERVLLSAEQFAEPLASAAPVADLARFARSLGYGLHVVFYIRPQPALLNSLYTQNVKNWRPVPDMDSYLTQEIRAGRHDYTTRLAALAGQPDIQLTVRPFSRSVLDRGILRDIAEVVGLDPDDAVFSGAPPHVNVAPGPKTVAALLRLRRLASWHYPHLKREVLSGLSTPLLAAAGSLGWNAEKCGAMQETECAMVEQHFAASNDRLASTSWSCRFSDVYTASDRRPPMFNMFDPEQAPREERRAFAEFMQHARDLLAGLATGHRGPSAGLQ